MINGGYPETPDNWIERQDDGEVDEPECQFCIDHAGDSMMPPHEPSIHCESGKLNHCTCNVCY